jgi:hypothetical protein
LTLLSLVAPAKTRSPIAFSIPKKLLLEFSLN